VGSGASAPLTNMGLGVDNMRLSVDVPVPNRELGIVMPLPNLELGAEKDIILF